MGETLVVDRIEGDIAVCENRSNGNMINIQLTKLPSNVKEGSVIKYFDGKYSIDLIEQEEIESRIKDKMNNLWE